MIPCDECEARLLDYQYGLLEPAEAAAVEEHLAACQAACPAALAAASKAQSLLAKAAKVPFPDVTFVPPPEPAVPAASRPTATGRRAWVPWAIAAGLLVAVGGLSLPVVSDWLGVREHRPDREFAELRSKAAEKLEAERRSREVIGQAEKKLADARAMHDDQVKEWVAHEIREGGGAFKLVVTGPAAAVPGAPNEYTVDVRGPNNRPVPATIDVQELDSADHVILATKFEWSPETAAANKIHLPASAWEKVPPGEHLILKVTATDKANGAKAVLAEPIHLMSPVFTTFLVTDKPLYRPGEPVFFRSVTLDRTTFLPPSRDLSLRYEIVDGKKAVIATATGRAEPVRADAGGKFEAVPGPDGKPVRGVGSGVFQLSEKLPGGEYTLRVFEVPANHPADGKLPPNSVVLATRKFTVLKYTTEKYLKTLDFDARTYGPGDTVRAKLTVRDQGKAAAGVTVFPTVKVDGVSLTAVKFDLLTSPDGSAKIEFVLPSRPDLKEATVEAKLIVGQAPPETILRSVPLAANSLTVEFFPEGGDLVAGVPCRVYFRATSPDGKPADISGYLTDGTRSLAPVKTVTDPDHPGANQGAGVFAFTPEAGKRYYLKLLRPVNVTERVDPKVAAVVGGLAAANAGVFPLPKPIANGVGLRIPDGVLDAAQPIRVSLAANDRRTLFIGAYARGVTVASGRVIAEPGKPAEVVLTPRADARGGVTRVTVFDEPDPDRGRQDLTPVAERLIFRRPAESLKLGFTPDRKTHAPGDGVTLDLTAANETGQPSAAVLLVAVVNQSVLTMADDKVERMLPAHFLLAGEVQHPDELEYADFFLTGHPKAAESLDLLLGTQGWRRFAEQNPGRFRSTNPGEEKDRFLVSTGVRPSFDRPLTESADDTFVPKYRETARKYASVIRQARESTDAASNELQAAIKAENAAIAEAVAAGGAALPYFDRLMDRRGCFLAALAIGLVAGGSMVLRPVRRFGGRPVTFPCLGLGALSAFASVLLLLGYGRSSDDWRETYEKLLNRPAAGGREQPLAATVEPADDLRESFTAGAAPKAVAPGLAVPETDPRFRAVSDLPAEQLEQVLAQLGGAVMPDAKLATPPRFADAYKRATGHAPSPVESAAIQKAERKLVRHTPFIAREYAHTRTQKPEGDTTRTDFTETVYWQPLLVLPSEGKGSVRFQLSDAVQAYRVLVAGHSLDGRLGATTGLVEVRKPLAVDLKLPAEVTAGDRIDLPVTVANGTAVSREVRLDVWSDHLKPDPARAEGTLTSPARATAGTTIPLAVPGTAPIAKVRLRGQGGPGLTDAVERTVAVAPDGFPASGAVSGLLRAKAAATLALPDQLVPGTLTAKVVVYTNPVAEVRGGLDGLLREPHGCFEQSSTANYPNVLILDYLRELGPAKTTAVENARGLLERGYARLTSFEVAKAGGGHEGFEWFGQFPPHEPLTAYGLMQFADMARVYPVDPGLLVRTREFLLARRDGSGGFRRHEEKHEFGNVPAAVADAYVLWAVTEAERHAATPVDLARELVACEKAATESDDPYPIALVANARLNRRNPGTELLAKLAARQQPDGSVPGAATTITRSHGPDAVTETTALAALAWLKDAKPSPYEANARLAVQYLHSRRGPFGAFGSTQATILALKALVEHARTTRKVAEAGRVVVRIGGKEIAAAAFAPEAAEPLTLDIADAARLLQSGANAVEVECTGKEAYPFTVSWAAASRKPAGDPGSAVRLTTTLDKTDLTEGQTARMTVRLENATAAGQGMAVAVVGLPAGLKLPPDAAQLKALAAAGTIAYWEQSGRELVFYWRGLAPKQDVAVALDLIADVPGEFRGPAGRAYLYYHPQSKHWTDPLNVRVRPANP
jgi:hypothetical protein